MTILDKVRAHMTTRPPTTVRESFRTPLTCSTCKGIITAVSLLCTTTLLLTGPLHLHRSAEVVVYLAVLVITTWIGSVYAAAGAVIAATLVVDYFFTAPLHVFTPLQPDMVTFTAAAIGASVLARLASSRRGRCPTPEPVDVAAATDAEFHRVVGSHRWSAVYQTPSGELYAIHGAALDDQEAAQQLADGVHGLTCPGCERCGSGCSLG